MSTGEPGWYQDPGGQPGTRWWDGTKWGDQVRPPGPSSPRGSPSAPAAPASEQRATFDPPRFDSSPGALFQTRAPAPPPARRSPVLWIAIGAAVVIVLVGMLLISRSGSHSSSTSPLSIDQATTTAPPGPTVAPHDAVYSDTGSLYTMATGSNWTAGPPGAANSATWTVALDSSTSAQVQVFPSKLQAPEGVDALTTADANSFDPNRATNDPGDTYIVDGTGSDHLADGTPAGTIALRTNPLDTTGPTLSGVAFVATKGTTGAMVLILCPPAVAASCEAALLPYARTIQLTPS